jgi:glucose/arabinose dehydrogenase
MLPLLVGAAACADRAPTQPVPVEPDSVAVRFTVVASGLAAPTELTAPPNDARLFVTEQAGRVRILRGGQLLDTPFLDITARVRSGGERGLLGLAFHPQYAATGEFFVSYTDLNGNSRVERYRASSDPDRADAASGRLVLAVEQPFSNHNGGQIAFGPDGMLYIALGDGGSGGDPQGHGQNRNTLLGSLLRVDVSVEPYRSPADNPYASGGGRPEIWAIGLRNPWRFSFDRERGLLYIADVGQNRREEVNVQPVAAPGLNYGWNIMEGRECYTGTSCDMTGLTLPVLQYPNPAEGCSITGGHVYRGAAIAALRGWYLFADYCRGWVRAFRYTDSGTAADLTELSTAGLGNITAFGRDSAGELYVLTAGGTIYRIDNAGGGA